MVTLKGIESALVKKLLASQCLETDAYTMCAKDNDASIELMIKMRSKKIVVNYETRFWASSSSIFLSKNLDFNVDFTSSTTTYDEEDKTLIIFIPAKGVAPQEREAVVPEPEEENNNNEVLVQKIKEVAKEVVKDFSHKMCITKAEEGVYVHLYDDMEGVEVLYSQKSSCLVLKKKGSFFTQKRLIIAIVDGDIVSEYSHGIGCIRKHDTLDSLLDLSQAEVSFSKETKHLQIFIPTSTE